MKRGNGNVVGIGKNKVVGRAFVPPENPLFELDPSTKASKELKVSMLHFWEAEPVEHPAARWETPLYGGGGYIPHDNDYVHHEGHNYYILQREFTYDMHGRLTDVVIVVREHHGERHVHRLTNPPSDIPLQQD